MIITVTFNPAVDKTAKVTTLVPGGLNRLSNVRQDVGGKGINVSKTIHALHCHSIATGFIAGNTGQFIQNSLNELGIDSRLIEVPGETRTNLKVLDRNMELTELNEPGPAVDKQAIDELLTSIEAMAQDNTWVVLSGNVGGQVDKSIYRSMIERFRQSGIHCVLDADGELFREGIQAGPAVIKPNRHELAEYFSVDENMDDATVVELASRFLNDDTKLVVVSMGIDGSIFITRDEVLRFGALSIDYRSAVGAGDAMVAAITVGMEQNLPLEELATLAVATSAGACMSEGTSPADYDTVLALQERVTIRI